MEGASRAGRVRTGYGVRVTPVLQGTIGGILASVADFISIRLAVFLPEGEPGTIAYPTAFIERLHVADFYVMALQSDPLSRPRAPTR
jgi:hypothetical protein